MSTSIFIFHSQELPSLEAYIDHHFTSHKKLLGLGGLGLGGLGSLKVENYLGSLQAYIDFKFVYKLTSTSDVTSQSRELIYKPYIHFKSYPSQ